MMLRQLVVVAVGLPVAVARAQVGATSIPQDSLHPISLQEAVPMAQRNAPAAVQARGQLRTTSSSVRSAYGAFLPSLTVQANQTQQSGQRFDNQRNQFVNSTQPWNYTMGVSTGIELFDGGRR